MTGRLSLVATPIGRLDDITLRAISTLREADLVLAEDTRRTKTLLGHHGIGTPLKSFHAHSPAAWVTALCDRMEAGAKLALVSDAGTPLVSDPGAELAAEARQRGIHVEAVPGPSAPLAALCTAGFVVSRFRFVGFLPRGGKRRRDLLAAIAADTDAVVLFESPHRLHDTLSDLAALLGERTLAVCRELTKLHEEVARGTALELAERFVETRGEITLVVGPRDTNTGDEPQPPDEDILLDAIGRLLADGIHAKDIASQLASRYALPRRDIYQRVLDVARTRGQPDEP